MGKDNDYTTGNLLDFEYFSKYYKLIGIDLSKRIELENPDLKQKINLIGRFEDDRATMFFTTEKSEETTKRKITKCCSNSLIFTTYDNGNTKICE